MRSQSSVQRARRPAIGIRSHVFDRAVVVRSLDPLLQLRADLAQHRLDGQDHSLPKLDSAAPTAVVVYLRVLMHPTPDPVSHEVADHVKATRFGVLLNCGTDVAQMLAGTHFVDGRIET